MPWPGDQLGVWHEGVGVSVTPGDRLGQRVVPFTELPRPRGEQIGREDKDFRSKYAAFASCKWTCPASSCRSPWAWSGPQGWARVAEPSLSSHFGGVITEGAGEVPLSDS